MLFGLPIHYNELVDYVYNTNLSSLTKGRPIVICAKGDSDLEKKGYQCLQLPEAVDCLQGILTVLPLQLLSFHIAGLRGYDVCIF